MAKSDLEIFKEHPAYKYAHKVVTDTEFPVNKDVKKVCTDFIEQLETSENDEDYPYIFDFNFAKIVTGMTKLVNMATGSKAGTPVHDALAGFQWFFIIAMLCWKHRDNREKRRYEKSVLLIARKSGKTFLIAILFILLLLLEPKYSEFYSVAPDRELSGQIKKEMDRHIEMSPMISKHFHITNKKVLCKLTNSSFEPLATSNNRMDGRLAAVYVADEVGALSNRYPIDAMESSQMNLVNRMGVLISTAYESLHNPMTEEVDYAAKVIHGVIENERLFALLYRPDDNRKWLDDDELLKANPLAIDIKDNLKFLLDRRNEAVDVPSKQKTFKTKHMNIFVDGDETEVYISTEDLIKNRIEEFDWTGKKVYVGLDLSMSDDNTGVAMVHYDVDEDKFYIKSWAFIPEEAVENKSRLEKIDYRMMFRNGYGFANGDRIINYRGVEDFILGLEDSMGVEILGVGYDKWNAISTVNRLAEEGELEVIEVAQHSSTLHAPTKLLKEYVLQQKVGYEKNTLFEMAVANARSVYDTNLNSYVNKKKSNGKIDMLAATINAMTLWNIDILEGKSVYEERELRIL